MAWVAMAGIFLVGVGVAWEGVKGLNEPPEKKRKTPKGTAYTTIVVGIGIMIAGIVVPLVAFR